MSILSEGGLFCRSAGFSLLTQVKHSHQDYQPPTTPLTACLINLKYSWGCSKPCVYVWLVRIFVCIPRVLQKGTSISPRIFPSHTLHFGEGTAGSNLSLPLRVIQLLTALAGEKVKLQPRRETALETHPETGWRPCCMVCLCLLSSVYSLWVSEVEQCFLIRAGCNVVNMVSNTRHDHPSVIGPLSLARCLPS